MANRIFDMIKKRVVRYKPVPPDPDMHNAICGAKVINI